MGGRTSGRAPEADLMAHQPPRVEQLVLVEVVDQGRRLVAATA